MKLICKIKNKIKSIKKKRIESNKKMNDKKLSKFQQKLVKKFSRFNKFSWIVDLIVSVFFIFSNNTLLFIFGIFLLIYTTYKVIKCFIKVKNSDALLYNYLRENRVLGLEGKQRVGKTSLACNMLKVLGSESYTNIPIKIRGKMTKKLTTKILSCQVRIPERSNLFIDECNLFYNNVHQMKSTGKNRTIFGQSMLEQCIGHFTDGNIIYASTDIERLPSEIRRNISSYARVLGQYNEQYSIIGRFLIKLIYGCLGFTEVHTGLRCWRVQHLEKISASSYTFDLSNAEVNGRNYAPIYHFCTFNDPLEFEYNDRYMLGIYKDLPMLDNEGEIFTKLEFTREDLPDLFDSEITRYIFEVVNENL